jgi:hypothetical protein
MLLYYYISISSTSSSGGGYPCASAVVLVTAAMAAPSVAGAAVCYITHHGAALAPLWRAQCSPAWPSEAALHQQCLKLRLLSARDGDKVLAAEAKRQSRQ